MRHLMLVVLLAGLFGCEIGSSDDCCDIRLVTEVPPDSGAVFMTGNLPQLGPWRPDGQLMSGDGEIRTTIIRVARGQTFEYKFTLGSWDREALNADGHVPANFSVLADAHKEVTHRITRFKPDPLTYFDDWRAAGIKGRMEFWPNIESVFLDPLRHVEIWLPPGYDDSDSKRYPVLYAHDGQNLFDPRRASTGVDWGVDETIVRLAREGQIDPPIVVGIWSSADRGMEYSPWHDAPEYARFLIEELKPRVDRQFRTLTDAASTATMGASLGGLISYYLVTHHPEVFGACGCMSTHFPISEHVYAQFFANADKKNSDRMPYILRDIAAGATVPDGARYWFDYGGHGLDAQYGETHQAVREWLLAQGKTEDVDFVIREYPQADHNEASWRARLADPLTFLFGR
ncbi:MAG: hypothetical protein KJO54_06955 [Gammaproteobacteria bacterium]|nr:hypothetical protein [Gammaproteobacteria bacterium]NNF60235.1 hypothetical protein [Gammaproteobacteria bacterium]NNM20343.1 hypothetical protein [Gammaproteobacteria bacterium]